MHILIVEDEEDIRILMTRLLAKYGTCDQAQDGEEGIELFQKSLDTDKKYDLICLDIRMPVLDGHETLKKLRKIEGEKGIQPGDGVKVIMTTALSDPRNFMDAFHEQCESYLVKPIDKQKLHEQLISLGLIES